jgi:DNA-directed RNA polymerase subunit RPC12/RpoP
MTKKKITIELLQCTRCGHEWWPRVLGGQDAKVIKPVRCASCNSPYWDRQKRDKK